MSIKKFISGVGAGAYLLAISSLLSRFLGMARDFIFAKIFGVGLEGGAFALDAYFAAFRIPDLMYTLLIAGAMSAAFIPLYSRLKKDSLKDANRFASQILNVFALLLLLLAAVFWLLAPWILPLLFPNFDASTLEVTIDLTRIMLLSPIFLGLSSVLQGIENTHKQFLGMALAPIFYNLSIIVAALWFGTEFGVYALAWGVVVGAVLHFLIQIPPVLGSSYRYVFVFSGFSQSIKEFIHLSLPRMFGLGVTQLSLWVDTILASLLTLGSLSIFNYALNLQSLPYGVVAVSLAVAIFPRLSEEAEDKVAFVRSVRQTTVKVLFWVLPATVGLFLLKDPLVRLLLEGGAFDSAAASMTSLTLGIFVWAGLGQSLIPLFARAFYALKETKTPVYIALCCVILNMFASFILTQVLHFEVWALAVSAILSSSLNALFLVFFLARRLEISFLQFFSFSKLFKMLLGAILMTLTLLVLLQIPFSSLLLQVLILVASGVAVYMSFAFFTRTIPSLRKG